VGGGSDATRAKGQILTGRASAQTIEQRRIMLAFFCKTKLYKCSVGESRPNPSQYSFANTQLTGASRSLESVSVVCH
jgi:hypothetical protein